MIEHIDITILGTAALKNKLGITDPQQLATAEADLTAFRLAELRTAPIRGGFDSLHLQEIHHHICQDLYDWAGELRPVDAGNRLHAVVQGYAGARCGAEYGYLLAAAARQRAMDRLEPCLHGIGSVHRHPDLAVLAAMTGRRDLFPPIEPGERGSKPDEPKGPGVQIGLLAQVRLVVAWIGPRQILLPCDARRHGEEMAQGDAVPPRRRERGELREELDHMLVETGDQLAVDGDP